MRVMLSSKTVQLETRWSERRRYAAASMAAQRVQHTNAGQAALQLSSCGSHHTLCGMLQRLIVIQ
jgi:hypothetical protein